MIHVQLPDRKEISLFEAVTAFVYGAPRDASSGPLHATHASDAVEKELRGAALAGKVRFHGLKSGNNKYQEIDPDYFHTQRFRFVWNSSEIRCSVPVDEIDDYVPGNYGGEYDTVWCLDWLDVHLDREQFASLLKDMGVSVEPGGVSNAEGEQEIYATGLAGRPSAVDLALPIAERRLAAGDYPDTKTMFSEQIVDAVAKAHPRARKMTAKALRNNPKFGELWRRRPQCPK